METKRSFCLIICCCVLASVLIFSYGTASRNLFEVQEDGNGQSKAGLMGHASSNAPSQAGRDSPPTSRGGITGRTRNAVTAMAACSRSNRGYLCVPGNNRPKRQNCTTYNRLCH
ncbi:uncharacterized protein LOC120197221 [Hibiscus syriacus]|uniref:uncharacterized protein LOC120197221 n=1 Tax=Hibiscus syriacus TaxID=106335 RepID=UPI001924F457|nr:uncharacterized protein LOC120197221 [Hibiscus syriacus]